MPQINPQTKPRKPFNTNLMLLLLGRIVSDIGSSVIMLIMPLYILDIGGSASTIGLFSFLAMAPILLMFPFGGVIGDRLNRKTIMVSADLASAGVVFIMAALSAMGLLYLPLLLALQVLVSTFFGFFDPASKGMVPKLVDKEDLKKTNSKIATARILSGVVAPLVAVGLYIRFGITLLFLLNAISFLFSGISESFIQYHHEPQEGSLDAMSILTDLRGGFTFIMNNSLIRRLCLYFFAIFAMIQPIFALILPLVYRTQLSYPDQNYGYLQVSLFVGALVGSMLVNFFGDENNLLRPLKGGIVAMTTVVSLFALVILPQIISALGKGSPAYYLLFTSVLFFLYMGFMFIIIPMQTIIQTTTPDAYMSRVFSIVGLIMKGGMPLGALLYGGILDRYPLHWVTLVTAAIIIGVSVYFLRSIRHVSLDTGH